MAVCAVVEKQSVAFCNHQPLLPIRRYAAHLLAVEQCRARQKRCASVVYLVQSAVCVGEHASADDEDVLQTFFKLHGRNVSVVAEHEHGTLALKVCHVPHSLDVPNLSRFKWGGNCADSDV